LSYSTVRDYIAKRRPEILADAGRAVGEAFVPQIHLPGAEAEVDFADLWVILRGVKTRTFLFTMRLSHSGKAAHRAFATQGQEAFLEGHVHAFEQFGGVPVTHIRYDNLKSAVFRVLFGRDRDESQRWVAFRSHYGFDAFYCQPGVEGAHEKGGVEGEVAGFAAPTASRCRSSTRSPNSTNCLTPPTPRTTTAASPIGRTLSASTSRSNAICCARCPARRSRPG
jgi:hypothetical protein